MWDWPRFLESANPAVHVGSRRTWGFVTNRATHGVTHPVLGRAPTRRAKPNRPTRALPWRGATTTTRRIREKVDPMARTPLERKENHQRAAGQHARVGYKARLFFIVAKRKGVPIDDRTSRVEFTRLGDTATATVHFGDDGRLVDFVADDRRRHHTLQRWWTPVGCYRRFRDRWVMSFGEARWHAPPRRANSRTPLSVFTNAQRRAPSVDQPTARRSTTKTRVSFGAITPPAPAAP